MEEKNQLKNKFDIKTADSTNVQFFPLTKIILGITIGIAIGLIIVIIVISVVYENKL